MASPGLSVEKLSESAAFQDNLRDTLVHKEDDNNIIQSSEPLELSPAEERKLLRRIDLTIVPYATL